MQTNIPGIELDKQKPKLLQIKIVYWGPGESGKTTNYEALLEQFPENRISKGYQVNTTDKRTLWQDSVHLKFPITIKGNDYQLIIQITTCTGQERFLSTREYVIHGADGVIFVADSDPEKMEQNIRSFNELLAFVGRRNIPWLIQLNKQDLKNAISVERFKNEMELPSTQTDEDGHLIVYPAITIKRKNVVEIFTDLIEKILLDKYLC